MYKEKNRGKLFCRNWDNTLYDDFPVSDSISFLGTHKYIIQSSLADLNPEDGPS